MSVQIRNVVYARGESGEFVKEIVFATDEGELTEMLTAEEVARLEKDLELAQ